MSTRRALLFSFVDRYSGMFLSIVSSMVLARMLTPADIGVFSVASAPPDPGKRRARHGRGPEPCQAKQLDNDQIRAVWTIQVAVGLLLAVVVAGLAIPAAAFYREPRMTPVLLVMAGTFLINPEGAITYAMLMRQMRFQQVAVMRFCANLAGFIVSLYLAFREWGPMSLAVGAGQHSHQCLGGAVVSGSQHAVGLLPGRESSTGLRGPHRRHPGGQQPVAGYSGLRARQTAVRACGAPLLPKGWASSPCSTDW